MIRLRANKNNLTVVQSELLTSGSMNIYPVQFFLSSDWEDLDKIVCFRIQGELPEPPEKEPTEEDIEEEENEPVTSADVPLEEDNICIIPYAMTYYPNVQLQIGIYGTDPITQDIILPTIWTSLGTIKQGVLPSGVEELPPGGGETTGGVTSAEVVNIIKKYNAANPVQYNAIVGVPEPITNRQLEEMLK